MDRHARVVQAALQLRDELPALLGDEWPQLDARLAAALQAAIEHPGADRLTALLAAARAHPLAATRFDDLLGGNWRSRPIAPDGQPNRGSFEAVEVLYATNRARGSPLQLSTFYAGQPADGDQVELGRCVVTLPTDRERGELNVPGLLDRLRGLDPARHVLLVSIDPLREHDFAAALGAAAPQRRALVFIHGYNVAFDDAMRRTAQLKVDLAYAAIGPVVGFSWPSRASYLGYAADADSTERTAPLLASFILKLQAWAPGMPLQIVAHSMGSRVLARAIKELHLAGKASKAQVQHLALAAPDIDRGVFQSLAAALRASSERVTLYASANDRALWVSKLLHRGPRAGDAGDRIVATEGVDTIDASLTDSSLLRMNHGYFAGKLSVLTDLGELLRHGTPPVTRQGIRPAPGGKHWVLRP